MIKTSQPPHTLHNPLQLGNCLILIYSLILTYLIYVRY